MTQNNLMLKIYLATITEENYEGFHRETLWYGGTPGNLGLMIIDAMSDWYEPYKDRLDESIVKYHKMLEDNENLTFDMMEGEGFNADGMSLRVKLTNNLNDMFVFIVSEICKIFAKNGEKLEDFASLAEFRKHFTETYDIDSEFRDVLEGINEVTISKALYLIDMKYDYLNRHFRSPHDEKSNV